MLNRKISNFIAAFLLAVMFILMFASAWNESAIMDEMPHIAAGYSYLTQNDMRLNPEHPPLIKDFAALPLLFLNLNFPLEHFSWKEDINGQWASGAMFLYESGNDADKIIRFARLPVMLLTVLFGWLFFRWTRGRYGDKVGLLALFFFTTSPSFIAHGRYVTTDIAAAFGFFIGIAAFIKFLEHDARGDKKWKYLVISGVVFGIAELLKFSLVLLLPLYFLLAAVWVFLWHYDHAKGFYSRGARLKHLLKEELKIIGKTALIMLIGLAVIYPVYLFHTWGYPAERQLADAEFILESFGNRFVADSVVWMNGNAFLRPLGEYLLGILMVIQRAAGGNTAYFLGEVTNVGWWYYFPVAYLLKEQFGFHLLSFLALVLGIRYIWKSHEKSLESVIEWMRDNWTLASGAIFVAVYWAYSMHGNLNIGVRHVLPTFPFIYLLVAREIIKWSHSLSISDPQNFYEWMKSIYEKYISSLPKYLLMSVFVFWLFFEAILAYPYYLSYYNELAGGPMNGYKYIVDSNYDWGQDLKRLNDWMKSAGVEKINLDYFGGGSPSYYLGEKFNPWQSSKGVPAKEEWFAVSAGILQNARGTTTKGFWRASEDSYEWLDGMEPYDRAGTSIFIYKF